MHDIHCDEWTAGCLIFALKVIDHNVSKAVFHWFGILLGVMKPHHLKLYKGI